MGGGETLLPNNDLKVPKYLIGVWGDMTHHIVGKHDFFCFPVPSEDVKNFKFKNHFNER